MRRCPECDARIGDGWRCVSCGWAPGEEGGCLFFAPELARGDGTDADYADKELFDAESRHFWFRARSRLVVWALQRHFSGARTLLEIGCGTGGVLQAIRNALPLASLVGSDIRTAGLRLAGSRLPGVELYQLDARRLPFRDHFDVVGAFDVLEHLEDDEDVLAEIRRTVRPGGGLVATVPQHAFLWSPADDFSRHKRRYSRGEIVRKVERAGFSVRHVTSFFTLLLPVLIALRWRQRRAHAAFDPARELRVPPLANAALEWLMRGEHLLLRTGRSLPFGGSLLLVAERPPG